jgi:nucleoside-diphosphate-sugar epimerase
MKIVVTGTEGYLGSLLAPVLLERGHEVSGVEHRLLQGRYLYNAKGGTPKTIPKSIRHLTADDLKGQDAVVQMAELSNDPLGELHPDITCEINRKGTLHLARTDKAAGV